MVPLALQEKVDLELMQLEGAGVIEPIQFSEWATPIVKSNGMVRVRGDYKVTINKSVNVDSYTLPLISDLFASLPGGQTFSKLDLAHAYLQLQLDEESKVYTTITTQKGWYCYNRLPFGISSTPATFQRTMETILQGLPHTCIYIDDILVTGRTQEEHLHNLDKVLTRLKNAGFRLKEEKCAFMLPETTYTGHVISSAVTHRKSRQW